ncbi:MAG: hypothetical protein P4L74_04780 [Candidatus Doudnabacteria bacterium]|nr:hypothetical protein [Candidatus Doudnabacteria bacterium]
MLDKIFLKISRHPTAAAAAVLAFLVLIFISPSFFQGRFLAPVDTAHFVAPYLDITTQMLPWWNLSREIIRSGHFPFWNVFSGNGLPLMANMQSAVFFPLTWLFYFFNIRFALGAYAFVKLFLMGMFTYLYLRELKLRHSSSLLGAILFAFCNSNAIWFLWPLTSVILILPLSFYLIEKYFNSADLKYALWLAPVTALGLFAGHPQTFFYIFCAIYGYTIFKAFSSGFSLKQGTVRVILLSAIYFLGFAISLVAVLPFLEYLKLSANLNYRAGFAENPFYLQPLMFLANLIPDFYGNTGVKNFSYLLVPNYGELALGYIGITGLLLGLCAFGRTMKKQIWFFIAAALLSLALVYHAPVIYSLINKLPGFNLNYNNRLLYLWAFFASVFASFGLENILNEKVSRKRLNWSFGGFLAFSIMLILANRLATHGWQFAHNLDWHTVSLWQDALIAAFFANLIIAYLILKRLSNKSAIILLFTLVCLETAIHGMIFMKTARPQNFYPQQPALTYLQNQYSQNFYRVFTYGDNLLPNIGTWYHIDELNDHDTIYLTSNKKLKSAIGNYNYSPEYTFSDPNLNALRFLSAGYLLYPAAQGLDFLKAHPTDVSLAFKDNNYSVLKLNNPLPRAFTIQAGSLADLDNKLADIQQGKNLNLITPAVGFTILEDGSENIVYNAPMGSYLVTTDNYYPGWSEEWGTAVIPMQNAMGLRAVEVPAAGQNGLSIRYHPKDFGYGYGWKLSMAAALLWLSLYFWQNKKSAKTGGEI